MMILFVPDFPSQVINNRKDQNEIQDNRDNNTYQHEGENSLVSKSDEEQIIIAHSASHLFQTCEIGKQGCKGQKIFYL